MNKNIKYQKAFNIKATVLKKLGVYDGYVNKNPTFYVFSKLFKDIEIEEFKN
jgi:hypothetical protein